jgi:hypothetical protein
VSSKKRIISLVCLILLIAGGLALRNANRTDADAVDGISTALENPADEPALKPTTMSDVLDLARQAREHLAETLDDYTVRFIKQDRDTNGVLTEQAEMLMKVQTRLRGDREDAPLRAYIQFVAPESKKGREIIWGEDLNDGKLCVHETGLLGLKRLNLEPTGFLAMQGQRYPISHLGMVSLVEKLIERGERDRDNPNITITIVPDYPLGDVNAELLQIKCSKPRGGEDDFSSADVVIDRARMLVLMFRSFGWPEKEGDEIPLLESYTYHDVEINVGLTDEDFDPDNPKYNFPTF